MTVLADGSGRGQNTVWATNGGVPRETRPSIGAEEARGPYVPTETAVCSVERSSLTPGPMVEETAARKR